MSMALDFTSLFAPGLPPPAVKWNGFAKYNFIGGHNDADQVPLTALIELAHDREAGLLVFGPDRARISGRRFR